MKARCSTRKPGSIQNEKKLASLYVTDKKTSICVKSFMLNQKWEDVETHLKNGDHVRIKGQAQWDRFDNCVTVMADSIEKTEKKVRKEYLRTQACGAPCAYEDELHGWTQ